MQSLQPACASGRLSAQHIYSAIWTALSQDGSTPGKPAWKLRALLVESEASWTFLYLKKLVSLAGSPALTNRQHTMRHAPTVLRI